MTDYSAVLSQATLPHLQIEWQRRLIDEWREHPEYYLAAGQRALQLGEPLMAYDFFNEGAELIPQHLLLQRHLAFAAARAGATQQAMEILTALVDAGENEVEIWGMLARCHKDLWLAAQHGPVGREHLRQSQDLYHAAFKDTGSYWTGINAATLALAQGNVESAQAISRAVQAAANSAMESAVGVERYWVLATLGEAAIISGNLDAAREYLLTAVATPGAGLGEFASTRRNLELLVRAQSLPVDLFADCFPSTQVVVFSGHMLDAPDRRTPRFPATREAVVAQAIADYLEKIDAKIGFSSAAQGGDLLFLEAMLRRGAEINVVLPHPPEQFIRTSVDRGDTPHWVPRFEAVLDRAARVVVTSNAYLGRVSYRYASRVILGLARARAQQVVGELRGLAVWNGAEGQQGGTAEQIHGWQRHRLAYEVIHPCGPAVPATVAAEAEVADARHYEMVALMFADAVGFSKLADEQIPLFIECFLGGVAEVLDGKDYSVLVRNTWGDGLYFVIANVRDAGLLALDLAAMMRRVQWGRAGLPPDLNARFALHCGPAYPFVDPVTRQPGYSGVHVSRAARIEPVTPPGEVYCSESFAAMCSAEGVTEFRTDYVGQLPLAKKYGIFPAYRLMRVLDAC